MTERLGQKFGNYRLTRFLGEGGFASVYLAEHIHLHTPAAIKILNAQLSSQEAEQFRHEAYLLARFNHPNIVRMLDFGQEESAHLPFLVMHYASHGTLRQRNPRESIVHLNAVRFYVKSVAAALQYAHDTHIIHRDVKPENMLIGDQNEILLSDFGIALLAQNTLNSFQQGTPDLGGTASYMAPEQIQGKARPASDQYALAIVVYEWLCGVRPFQGTFMEVCSQHIMAQPLPLRQKLATISPEVEWVVMKALDKDPKQRFGTIQAFATAFEEAADGRTTTRNIENLFATVPSDRRGYPQGDMVNRQIEPLYLDRRQNTPPLQNDPTTPSREAYQPLLPSTAQQAKKPRGFLIGIVVLALLLIIGGGSTFAVVTFSQNAHVSATATATTLLTASHSATATATSRFATSTATAQLATATALLTSTADFTTQSPTLTNMTVVANESAFQTDHSLLLPNQQVVVAFTLQPHVNTVSLSLHALVSQNGPNNPGSSPISISCNTQVVVSNYTMPGNGYSANTTSIQIPMQQLTQGSNQIRLVVASNAQTAFWLYSLGVTQSI
jgi:serine/threonine protein kinase